MEASDKAGTGALLSDHGSRREMADGARSSKDERAPCWGWDPQCTSVLYRSTNSPRANLYVYKMAQHHATVLHRRVCARNIMWSFFSYTQFQVEGNLREARILIWIKRQVRNRQQDLWVISTASSWTLGEVTQRKEGKGGDQEQRAQGLEDTEEDHPKGKLHEGVWERNEKYRRK